MKGVMSIHPLLTDERPVGRNAANRGRFCFFVSAALLLGSLHPALGQDLPTTQPKLLTIIREQVKIGRSAEHSKFEAAFSAAFQKAKSHEYYLAVTSMTGSNEAWYLIPHDSHAEVAETMKRWDKDPVLSAELDRLALADAEYISAAQTIEAVARPDLGVGTFPELSKARFFEISIFQIRPGCEMQFDDVAKAYAAATKRVAPKASYRAYQVLAGMSQPTFLFFSSVEDYAEFDQRLAEGPAIFKGANSDEMAAFQKFREVAERVESNRYRLDPVQSYVSKETREKDPDFWLPQ
jgi:hypothetical protein